MKAFREALHQLSKLHLKKFVERYRRRSQTRSLTRLGLNEGSRTFAGSHPHQNSTFELYAWNCTIRRLSKRWYTFQVKQSALA